MTQNHIEPPNELTEEQDDRRPGLWTILLLVLLILALIITLIWPVWWRWLVDTQMPPTPTPTFFQQI